MNILRKIITPTGALELTQKPYIILTFLIYIIQFTLLATVSAELLQLSLLLFASYLHINMNAQRIRNSGLRARYMIILSIMIYVLSAILIHIFGDDCESIGIKLNVGYDLLLIFILAIAPPNSLQEKNMELHKKEIQ